MSTFHFHASFIFYFSSIRQCSSCLISSFSLLTNTLMYVLLLTTSLNDRTNCPSKIQFIFFIKKKKSKVQTQRYEIQNCTIKKYRTKWKFEFHKRETLCAVGIKKCRTFHYVFSTNWSRLCTLHKALTLICLSLTGSCELSDLGVNYNVH